jgi:Tol biopolymer transport system component
MPVADGKPQAAPELVKKGIVGTSLGVTATGALYLGSASGSTEIRVASVDLNTGRRLPQPLWPFRASVEYDSQPAWSPDGKYLAYSSSSFSPTRLVMSLAIRSIETGEVRQLQPQAPRSCSWPNWAPDGRSLVCVTGTGVIRVDAQTGEVTTIASSPAGFTYGLPQFSRDGKKIYYLKVPKGNETGDNGVIVERELSSAAERELAHGNVYGATLSPDGRYFAVVRSDRSTQSSVMMLIPASGGEARELFRTISPQRLGVDKEWTPDSRSLICWRMSGDTVNVLEAWMYPIDGGAPRKLDIDTSGVRVSANNPNPIRVHPNGREIAYVATTRANEVSVLENFLPAAKSAK